MPSWKRVIVSGSNAALNSLTVTNGITGSLFGTASWANNATSASFATTASFTTSASFVPNTFLQNGNSFGAQALLGTNDNQNLALETSGSIRMFISSSGNIGIGTTSPSARLDVNGNMIVGAGNKSIGAWPFYISDSSNLGWKVSDSSGTSKFELYVGNGGINQMRLLGGVSIVGFSQNLSLGTSAYLNTVNISNTNGNVGIGTTAPGAKLDVRAQGALSTNIVFRVRNSTDTQNFLVVNGAGDVFNNGAGGGGTNTHFGENTARARTGDFNSTFGNQAGRDLTTGASNALFGYNAGRSITTQNGNTLIGTRAGESTIVNNTVAVGTNALLLNQTGTSNVAIGTEALYYTTASGNTAVGDAAGFLNTTGQRNIFLGYASGRSNTTGQYNTYIGSDSGTYQTTGNDNIFVGISSGRYEANGATNLTTATNSLFIGNSTRGNASGQTNQIVIGYSAIGLGSNTVVLGNDSIVTTALKGRVILGTTVDNGTDRLQVNGSTAINGNTIITGSLAVSQSLLQYSNIASVTSGSTSNVASFNTSSYTAAFFDYVTTSGTSARAGTVFTVWNGNNVEYTETSTNDIGNTSNLVLSASLSAGAIRLQATSLSGSWSVKTLARMI